MSKNKHAKKKADDGCPAWVHDEKPAYPMKLEVERAFVHWAVAKKITVDSPEWRQVSLPDLLDSLKLQHKRWLPIQRHAINTTSQRCMQGLSLHLARLRGDRSKIPDLMAAEQERVRDLEMRGTDGAEDRDDSSDSEDEERPIGSDGEEIKQGDDVREGRVTRAAARRAGPDGSDQGEATERGGPVDREANERFLRQLRHLGKRSREEIADDEDSDGFWQEVALLARWGMKYSRTTQLIEKRLDHMLRGTVLRLNIDTPCCSDSDPLSDADDDANDDDDHDDDTAV